MNERITEPSQDSDIQSIQKGPLAIIISGPSGAGKTELAKYLSAYHPEEFVTSVSVTTRDPRQGEIDGRSYYFVSDAEFDDMIYDEDFLEFATLYGKKRYGTLKKTVIDNLNLGKKTILTIDVQGFEIVKKAKDRCITDNLLTMFITPPTLRELESRLRNRNTISPEELARRLAAAPGEMAWKDKYDCVVTSETGNIHGDYLQAVNHINGKLRGRSYFK